MKSEKAKKKQKYTFGTITITPYSKKLINKILDTGRVSCGKYVAEFERKFAQLIGTKEAVAVSSGTDADALALSVLYDFGAKRGDEVIVPALSFVATGNAVLQAGFIPRFVDVELTSLNINPEKIVEAITEKTRAIMPVHLMGKPADMDRINQIAKKHKLYCIEDAAEAQGATYKKKNIGRLSDMAAFSLYIAHIISTIEGGVVTTDRKEFAEVLRSLRAHGRACKCNQCLLNLGDKYCKERFRDNYDIRFIFERIGFSSKMNELEAAIGLGYLDIYEKIFKKRMQNFLYLGERFRKFERYFSTIRTGKDEVMAPYAFAIILKPGLRFNRNELMLYLEKNGIETRTLFLSMPTQCPGFRFLHQRSQGFPEAEFISNNGLHIGVHQDIDKEKIDYFIRVMERFLNERL